MDEAWYSVYVDYVGDHRFHVKASSPEEARRIIFNGDRPAGVDIRLIETRQCYKQETAVIVKIPFSSEASG